MTIAKDPRRHVMDMAWRLYRVAQAATDRGCFFAHALAGASRFTKGLVATRRGRSVFQCPIAGSANAHRYGLATCVGGRVTPDDLTVHVGG